MTDAERAIQLQIEITRLKRRIKQLEDDLYYLGCDYNDLEDDYYDLCSGWPNY